MSLVSPDTAPRPEPTQPTEVVVSGGYWAPFPETDVEKIGLKGVYGTPEVRTPSLTDDPTIQFAIQRIYRIKPDDTVTIFEKNLQILPDGTRQEQNGPPKLLGSPRGKNARITIDDAGAATLTFTETLLPTPDVSAMTKNL